MFDVLENKNIAFCITGSYCTFSKVIKELEKLAETKANIMPIFSYQVTNTSTRFYDKDTFKEDIERITNKKVMTTMQEVEPIGPQKLADIVVIAPCTGNTLAKLANGITDTPVLLAAKAHLRNERPVVIAVSSNDGMSANAKNIGELLNRKNIYFVPYRQDNAAKKPRSLVADMTKINETIIEAIEGRQMQPIII